MAVQVHPDTILTKPEAAEILDKSSTLLTASDGSGDYACPVDLILESLGPAESPIAIVNTSSDFNALFLDTFGNPAEALTADPDLAPRLRQVRVVSEIYWCGGSGPSVAGCADEPGLRIAITRRSALLEGELWAHEAGHTRGLPHRNNTWTAVMHESVLPDHKELTKGECNKYRR